MAFLPGLEVTTDYTLTDGEHIISPLSYPTTLYDTLEVDISINDLTFTEGSTSRLPIALFKDGFEVSDSIDAFTEGSYVRLIPDSHKVFKSGTALFPGSALVSGPVDTGFEIGYGEVINLEAFFIADVVLGVNPLTVNFTDLSLGIPMDWHWDFGDGTHSYIQNPTHIYTDIGSYTVSLEVNSLDGQTDTETKINYIGVGCPGSISDGTYTVGEVPEANYQSVTLALADIAQNSTSQLVKLEIIADTIEGTWVFNNCIKNVEIYNQTPHDGDPVAGTPKINGATFLWYSNEYNQSGRFKIYNVHFKNCSFSISNESVYNTQVFSLGYCKLYNILFEGGSLEIVKWENLGANSSNNDDNIKLFNFKVWGMSQPVKLSHQQHINQNGMDINEPWNKLFVENCTILGTSDLVTGISVSGGYFTLPNFYTTVTYQASYDLRNICLVNCKYEEILSPTTPYGFSFSNLPPVVTGSNNTATNAISFANTPFYPNIVAADEFLSIDPTSHDFLKLKRNVLAKNGGSVYISYNTKGINNRLRPGGDGKISIGAEEYFIDQVTGMSSTGLPSSLNRLQEP